MRCSASRSSDERALIFKHSQLKRCDCCSQVEGHQLPIPIPTLHPYLQRELEAEGLDLVVEDGEDLGPGDAVRDTVDLELLLDLSGSAGAQGSGDRVKGHTPKSGSPPAAFHAIAP